MDKNKQKEIASRGGLASAKSDTSNRGFASMDKSRQREISSRGGKASQGAAPGKHKKPDMGAEKHDLSEDLEISQRDLNSLEEEEERGAMRCEDLSYSETDEDEDEGLGDGNIGRSTHNSRANDEEG